MNVIILGAGKVGKTLIKHMSNEDHDIIVIDQDAQKIEDVVNLYDVIGVVGNGGSYDILMEAGATTANLIICVTASDELNLLAGLMAKQMGTRHTIARVRNPDYSKQRDFTCKKCLNLQNDVYRICNEYVLYISETPAGIRRKEIFEKP